MPRRPARRRLAVVTAAAVLAGLAAPALHTPAAAAGLPAPLPRTTASPDLQKVVELRWAAVPGAVSYAMQVGTDPYWSDEADIFSLSTVATRLTLPVWLPHGDYLWRVAAVGQDGVRGAWSATLDPVTEEPLAQVTFARGWNDAPVPLAQRPADDTHLPTFRWTPVRTASEYQIQVSSSPDFGGPIHGQASSVTASCFTTRTAVTPFNKQKSAANPGVGNCWFDGFAEGEPMYWRVRALDQVADEVQELVTTPVVDSGISHLPPEPAEELDTTDCPGASSGVVAACTPAHPVEKGVWSTVSVFVPTAWPTAKDDHRLLPVVQTAPLPADLCGPTGSCRDVPTLDWSPVEGATSYRVYVALDRAYTNIQEIAETPGTSWTPTVQWRDSGVLSSYYYVVQACTSAGCGPVTSSPPSFRKSSVPVRLQDEEVTRTETVLAWDDYVDLLAEQGDATSEAAAYRVQVANATDTSFSAPLEDVTTDHSSHVSRTVSYGEGSFLWRVQAVDASGHKLRWSPVGAFTRDFTAPTVTSVSPSSPLDPRASVVVKLSESVTGASTATASLVPVAGGSAVPAVVTTSGSTVTVDPTGTLPVGATYSLVLTSGIRDLAGNPLTTVRKPVGVNPVLDDANAAFSWRGTWTTASSSMASYGRYHLSSTAGATATATTSGTGVRVYGCRGPSGGRFELWVDGVRKATGDTYLSYSSCGTLSEVSGLRAGGHVVQVKVLGSRQSKSTGTKVGLDGLRALG